MRAVSFLTLPFSMRYVRALVMERWSPGKSAPADQPALVQISERLLHGHVRVVGPQGEVVGVVAGIGDLVGGAVVLGEVFNRKIREIDPEACNGLFCSKNRVV